MQAIEGTLENGHLTLFSALPSDVRRARVVVLFEDAFSQGLPVQELRPTAASAENEFAAMSLAAWADEPIDETADWEAFFGLR